MIDIQPRSGHSCFVQYLFEMPTKIIFAQLCFFFGMSHHFLNIFLPHIWAKSSTMLLSSVRVLGSHLVICTITWDQK